MVNQEISDLVEQRNPYSLGYIGFMFKKAFSKLNEHYGLDMKELFDKKYDTFGQELNKETDLLYKNIVNEEIGREHTVKRISKAKVAILGLIITGFTLFGFGLATKNDKAKDALYVTGGISLLAAFGVSSFNSQNNYCLGNHESSIAGFYDKVQKIENKNEREYIIHALNKNPEVTYLKTLQQ